MCAQSLFGYLSLSDEFFMEKIWWEKRKGFNFEVKKSDYED
jgi:hypothetical protein